MTTIHHCNCGTLVVPPYPTVVCHCLVLVDEEHVVLVDTGIGLLDVQDPEGRLGRELIDAAGFRFDASDTAVARLGALGIERERVGHIVLTHGDPDHAGGLADFPHAHVHLAAEELDGITAGSPRYTESHFAHGPRWTPIGPADGPVDWFGLPARAVDLPVETDVLLVPLPGHTIGHAGVAVRDGERWLLHVGDAYYLRAELEDPEHPAGELAALRADDDGRRRASLDHLRRIARDHEDAVTMFGYHDLAELPAGCVDRPSSA